MENRLHWTGRDLSEKDKSLVRMGNAPRVIASRSLAISLPRIDGYANIAAATTPVTRSARSSYFRPHERLSGPW